MLVHSWLSGRILNCRFSQPGFDPSFENLTWVATLKSSDRTKQSICGWQYIYIYISIYIYIEKMYEKWRKYVSDYFVRHIIFKRPELIYFHPVKWFKILLTIIILKGFKYCYSILTTIFNITHLFPHSQMVPNILNDRILLFDPQTWTLTAITIPGQWTWE